MFTPSVSPQIQSLIREPLICDQADKLLLQRGDRKSKKEDGFLSSVPGRRSYTLIFEDDTLPENHKARNVVKVKSMNEVILYIGLLGESCEVYLSPEYLSSPDEWPEKIENIQPKLIAETLENAFSETINDLLRRMPLDIDGLLQSPIAVKDEDVLPGIVEPKFIHKKNPANALLSEPFYAGRLVYYNMLRHTEELRFDHESDHVQGMLLLEAMRQAGIATTHLSSGLEPTGGMTLMSYCTNFYNYVEHTAPIIVRSYTSYTIPEEVSEKDSYAICQVFQWGKLCAEATLNAVVFMGKERYSRHRERTEKFSARNRRLFTSKVEACENAIVNE